MIHKFAEFIEKWQKVLIAIVAIAAIVSGMIIYGNLPKRVDTLELGDEEDDKSVAELAGHVQKISIIQEEREKRQEIVDKKQDETQALLIDLIKKSK